MHVASGTKLVFNVQDDGAPVIAGLVASQAAYWPRVTSVASTPKPDGRGTDRATQREPVASDQQTSCSPHAGHAPAPPLPALPPPVPTLAPPAPALAPPLPALPPPVPALAPPRPALPPPVPALAPPRPALPPPVPALAPPLPALAPPLPAFAPPRPGLAFPALLFSSHPDSRATTVPATSQIVRPVVLVKMDAILSLDPAQRAWENCGGVSYIIAS